MSGASRLRICEEVISTEEGMQAAAREVQIAISTAERIAALDYDADRVRFEVHEIRKFIPKGEIEAALEEILLDAFIRGMKAAGR